MRTSVLVLTGSLGLGTLAIEEVDLVRDLEAVFLGDDSRFSAVTLGRTSSADLRTATLEAKARAGGATVATV